MLLSMNILLLLQQQPSSDGIPIMKTNFLDSRKLRQYVEPNEYKTFPVRGNEKAIKHNELLKVLRREHQNLEAEPSQDEEPIQQQSEELESRQQLEPELEESNSRDVTTKPTTYGTAPPAVTSGAVGIQMKIQKVPKPVGQKLGQPVVYGKSPKNTIPPLTEGSYVTPNEILQRTAVAIKTFNRAECLQMTVASFKMNYPDIPIFVADDSFEDTVSKNLTETYDVTYIRLPVDSGVGYGRNRLVEHIYKLGKLL